LPAELELLGIKGLTIRHTNVSVCTYCAGIIAVIGAVAFRNWLGVPYDDIEVLYGQAMQPMPGMKKTILLGKCMCKMHKNNPLINEPIPVNGCPPIREEVIAACQKAGIPESDTFDEILRATALYYAAKYADNPEFDRSFFGVE
jgi:hypothetical protein